LIWLVSKFAEYMVRPICHHLCKLPQEATLFVFGLFVCLLFYLLSIPCLWFCRSMRCWTQMVQYPLDSELLLSMRSSTSIIVCSKQASKHGYNSRKRHTKMSAWLLLGSFYHKFGVNRYDRYHIHRYDSFVLAPSTSPDPPPPPFPQKGKWAPIPCIHNEN
jgi:hypothetical protein